jgi:hypothetical protein
MFPSSRTLCLASLLPKCRHPSGVGSPASQIVVHYPSVLCSAKTASAHLRSLHSSLAPGYLPGSRIFVSLPNTARGRLVVGTVVNTLQRQVSWSAGTPQLPAISARRQEALPSSRVIPVSTCPPEASSKRRDRWCPDYLPLSQFGLLPSARLQTVGFLIPTNWDDYPMTTTIHISGLNVAACTLATPSFTPSISG